MIRAVLLDLDGTLADSMPGLRSAFAAFLDHVGAPPGRFTFEAYNGPPLAEIVADIAGALALSTPPGALLATYRRLIDQAYVHVAPCAGALNFVAEAKGRGLKLAVVTSNDRARSLAWLARHGLTNALDAVIAGEDVCRGKPDPEPYRRALTALDLDAAAAVAVEDGAQGARAALAAGLTTYLIGPDGPKSSDPPGLVRVADFDILARHLLA